MPADFAEGETILIDKPLDWTSFDVVRKIRSLVRIPKVGHAGTLDPLATGLLIVCTGKFTKRINTYMGMEKEYTGSIALGATTPSFDLETEPGNFADAAHITLEQARQAAQQFTGDIMQTPPQFSAIKKDGKRLYLSARKGVEVKLDPRPVKVSAFEIIQIEDAKIQFRIVCSTGTYIRTLANDLGAALGVGGYLAGLRRTRIGEFSVEDADTMTAFEQRIRSNNEG